jgi:hypothetical protein
MTAEFRSVQTRIWREDDWFQSLPTDARLLFIYLFTNPSASIAGIYRLPLRTIEFESGIPTDRIKELLAEFARVNKVHYDSGVVWVVRMRENQLPGKISDQVRKRLTKDIASIPDCPLKIQYLRHYGYCTDTVSIPFATDTDTDTHTDTETHTEQAASGGGSNRYGSRQARAAYHTVEAQKLGVDPETFRALVDKLIDAAKLRTLIEQGQNERKLTDAKDAALELVRMAVTTPDQVDTLIEAYRAANDWRKTPPTPQALSEYASQVADKLKPKPTKRAWVLDANGNRMKEVTV